MLDIMNAWTNEQKFYTERIDGSVSAKARIEAVDRFQASEEPGISNFTKSWWCWIKLNRS